LEAAETEARQVAEDRNTLEESVAEMTNYKGQLEERLKRASSAAAEARKDVEETIRLERQKQAIRAHIFSERQERVVKIEMAQDAMLEELQLKSEELRQRDKEKEKIEARGAKVLDDLMRMQEKAAKEKSGLEARWAKVHEEYSELRERQTGVVKAKVKAEQEAAKAIAEAQAAKKMAKANSAKAITAAKEASEAKAWAIAQAEAAAEIARKQQEKMVGFQARQAKVLEKLEAKGKKNDAAAELERKQAEEAFEKERAEFIRRQEEETDKIVKSKAKEQAELLQKKEEAAAKLMKSTEKLVKSMEKEKVELLRKKEELKAKLVQSTKKETAELFREKEEKKGNGYGDARGKACTGAAGTKNQDGEFDDRCSCDRGQGEAGEGSGGEGKGGAAVRCRPARGAGGDVGVGPGGG